MKLIIQIPCFNEEQTLPAVIRDLPRSLPGFDAVEFLVVDDGSTDHTADAARSLGVHHVVRLGASRGCGAAFLAGLRASVDRGADIVVNTDGDNQYCGSCISDLVAPILDGSADAVVGARPIDRMNDFSPLKKLFQRLGSSVVRRFSGTHIPDITSGFRAFSRDAALRLDLFSSYNHTLESIIQMGQAGMRIGHVSIGVNPRTRPSRLMTSMGQYIWHSAFIILRSYIRYRPMRTFFYLSLLPGIAGVAIGLRFLYYFFFSSHPSGHVQSLILAAILIVVAFHLLTLGILADLTGANRTLLQEILFRLRRQGLKIDGGTDS